MESNANLYISKTQHQINETQVSYVIIFSHNLAVYGGDMAVEDGTNLGVCDSNPHPFQTSSLNKEHFDYSECFLKVTDLNGRTRLDFNLSYASASINFTHNSQPDCSYDLPTKQNE